MEPSSLSRHPVLMYVNRSSCVRFTYTFLSSSSSPSATALSSSVRNHRIRSERGLSRTVDWADCVLPAIS